MLAELPVPVLVQHAEQKVQIMRRQPAEPAVDPLPAPSGLRGHCRGRAQQQQGKCGGRGPGHAAAHEGDPAHVGLLIMVGMHSTRVRDLQKEERYPTRKLGQQSHTRIAQRARAGSVAAAATSSGRSVESTGGLCDAHQVIPGA